MKNSALPYVSGLKNVMLSDEYPCANMKTDKLLRFFILA